MTLATPSATASCACSVDAPIWVCPVYVRMPGKGAVEPGLAARRLTVEYVDDGADPLRVQRLDQRRLVDDVRARGVDEDRARTHARQDVAIDESPRSALHRARAG